MQVIRFSKLIKYLVANRYIFLLAILSLGFLASLVRYSLRSFDIPIWDEQHYMYMAAGFYRLLQNPSTNTLYDMVHLLPVRQPGYPLLILPFLLVFGLSNSYFWGLFTNGLLYIASIFGIFLLARCYLSRLASFFAAFIFMFYSWTLFYVHFTYTETATSALCIWTILFLVKSNYFQSRKYSLLFGLFLGLGLLTRWVALVFIFGPLIYIFYQVLKQRLFKKKIILGQIAISFLVAFLIAFYPYYVNYYWVFDVYFKGHRFGGEMWKVIPEYERNPFSLYSLTFYLKSFAQLGIYSFSLIIGGFILALRARSKLKLLALAAIIPGIFFSFLSILKADRFIIPIYPYLAILSASMFDNLKNKNAKILLIITTVFLSIGTFLGTVWGKGPLTTISRPPNIYKSNGEEILDFIKNDSKNSGIDDPLIVSLFYFRPLDERLMVFNLYHQEKPLNINNFLGTIISDPESEAGYFMRSVLKEADYILTKSGQRTDDYFPEINYKTLKALISLFDNYIDISDYYAEKTKIWIYQDSSEVTIYKKKKEIPDHELKQLQLKFIEILKEMDS